MKLEQSSGIGWPPKAATAMHKYRRGADQGHVTGQAHLGIFYAEGRGVARDDVQAYKWLELAIAQLAESDPSSHDEFTPQRDVLAARMTAAQLQQARKPIASLKPRPETQLKYRVTSP
ncbi:hypothetical protein [Vineibacter terrae]|uniref:tetratricopeptide repeat protein n=1 Tax=Vineibacter terrae TaxID=2586908 RepID=UPI002E33D4EC|nr:hypothetical protein [Vineibacter terrae]HEX2887922.1 hypothetical protein [Vineibacter terrae]